jgi:hypothetical protein
MSKPNKRGLELSLTVIVLIILTIIIFIGGVALVWKFFAGAEEIKAGIELQTKQQIEALLREGTALVAIPVNTKQVRLGKETTFGLGIRNIQETQGFFVRMDFAGIYDQKGRAAQVGYDTAYIEQHWLGGFQEQGPFSIGRNKYEIIPLRVRVATAISEGQPTPKGMLVVFNVCVFAGNPGGECEVGNPGVYDKIHQVFVNVR